MQISRRIMLIGGAGCLLTACSHALVDNVPYSIGVRGEGNQVIMSRHAGDSGAAYCATVRSTRGIGEASFAWWGNASPHPLAFYFELEGLELFRLVWAKQTVNVSVNSMDHTIIQSVQGRDGAEVAVTPPSPYWMEVKLPTHARPGYLLTVPAAFVADGPRMWAIAWIDFFR